MNFLKNIRIYPKYEFQNWNLEILKRLQNNSISLSMLRMAFRKRREQSNIRFEFFYNFSYFSFKFFPHEIFNQTKFSVWHSKFPEIFYFQKISFRCSFFCAQNFIFFKI